MTPAMVHYGQAQDIGVQRQQTLLTAYAAHPERFVRGLPTPPDLPTEVWINKPTNNSEVMVPSEILFAEPGPQEVFGPIPDTILAH